MSNNSALEDLCCYNNDLTELDVSNNSALLLLLCDNNELTELDVSNNPALEDLCCGSNNLTELDVSKNLALEVLDCSNNNLTELDVSNNLALEYLSCYKNDLVELDVSKNSALVYYLDCDNNNDNFALTLTSSQDEKLKLTTGIGKVVLDSPSSEETVPTSLPMENDNSALYTLCKIIGCLILVALSIILLVKIIKKNKKVKDDLSK